MEIRNTTLADLESVMKIIDAAKRSLKSLGLDQWQKGYPNRESIWEDIAAGHSRVLCGEDGRLLATAFIAVVHEPTYDVIYDGNWLCGKDARYGVIHRVAVDPDCKGKGLVGLLFSHAFELCRRAGAASLRVDTHPGNLPMQRAILKFGFTYCGVILLSGNEEGQARYAYEKPVKPLNSAT